MSTWDKSTLDEMLFNYFEGTLSPDENSRLFLYLKQHPESYSEFESWSQTYAMRNVPLDDYEISAKLIKPDRSNRRWYFFMAFSIILVTAISVPFLKKEKQTRTVLTPTVSVPKRNSVETNPTKAPISQPKHFGKPDLKTTVAASPQLPVLEPVARQEPVQTSIDSIIAGEKPTVLEEPKKTEERVADVVESSTDSEPEPSGETKREVKTTSPKVEIKQPTKSVPKGSRNVKVDFKGGKDILRTNENF
jgi:hypothetical protein